MGRKKRLLTGRGRSRFRRKKYYPFAVLGIILALAAAVVLLAVYVVIPLAGEWFKQEEDSLQASQQIVAIPTPTPQPPGPTINLQAQAKEAVLNARNIFSAYLFENELVFSTGRDEGGNAKMYWIYIYDTDANAEEKQIKEIVLKNDDLLEPQISRDYIVYTDATRGSGGTICVYHRDNGQIDEVKTVTGSLPQVRFAGDYLAWTERTGSNQDKLYLYDIKSGVSVTIDVFDNSIYGQSAPGLSEQDIVWASKDLAQTDGAEPISVIFSYRFDEETPELKSYMPDMYVHDPMTNGRAVIWLNSNHAPDAELYVSIEGGPPRKIAEHIEAYGIGDTFAAFTVDQVIYVYYFDTGEIKRLSPDNERCILSSVSGDSVVWFQIFEGSDRDIIKYSKVG
ncbi:MAG: TolB family protein [Christensenellales bacterium]|jgi:hypothetical protein